ncbi:MAG TPA: phosphatase PAP2 family protein [Bryobacteraceae bacterium]|jgi:undecaprenyl-diphosphatase
MTRLLRAVFLRPLNWIGSHELGVLLAFAGVGAGVLAFVLIASEVSGGETLALDKKILLDLRRPDLTPKGGEKVEEVMRDFTALGGTAVLTLVTLSTAGFLMLSDKKHMALFLFLSVAGGMLASMGLKDFYDRPRPHIVPHEDYVMTSSFPSGHSMLSALTYLTLGALLARSYNRKRLKAYFLSLAALLTGLVGFSRMYLGVHWPTDVLAGWTAGATWATLCWLGARWLQNRRQVEPPE